MTWTTVSMTEDADLMLPPGWWWLRTSDSHRSADIRDTTETIGRDWPSSLRSDLAGEFDRMTSVAGLAGAVLLAGGSAADDNGQVVTASLMVVPDGEADDARSDPTVQEGPVARLELPAGAATRRMFLGTTDSPLGELVELEIQYAVAQPVEPAWLISFRTPAVHHATELLEAFDAIAATLRIHISAEPIASVFS